MINMPEFLLFTLIMMRMSGFILLNPIFGRRNISGLIKAGFIMVLSISLFSFTQSRGVTVNIINSLDYGILLIKEFSIGFVLGYVMHLFFYITSYTGAMIDFHMGMSMANVYDPQSNSTMPLTGSIFQVLMTMLFFTADGHLALLKIFLESEKIVPYTQLAFTPQVVSAILEIFQECTILAVKLSFPFFALELLAEVGVGFLMKVIPQINVFVVNIQVKVLLGDILLLILCVPVGEFLGDIVDLMVNTVGQVLALL